MWCPSEAEGRNSRASTVQRKSWTGERAGGPHVVKRQEVLRRQRTQQEAQWLTRRKVLVRQQDGRQALLSQTAKATKQSIAQLRPPGPLLSP